MKTKVLFISVMCFISFSCEDGLNDKTYIPKDYNVSGKVEKGPFVSGSTITIQPMSAKLHELGTVYTSTIEDHTGRFTFGDKTFETPFAALTANGYFFNEVEGKLSTGTLNLKALVDLSDSETVNVNILTHLKYQRLLNLVASGESYASANKQAQKELFTAFGLQRYAEKEVSRFSIAEGTEESASLISVSSLLLVERSEAALTEYLAKLSKEFAQSGAFSDVTKAQIKKDRETLSRKLHTVRNNIISRYNELGISVEVMNLTQFFDWDDDGIAGNETLKEGESVSVETNQLNVPNEGGKYKIKITSPIPVLLESSVDRPSDNYPPAVFILDVEVQGDTITSKIEDNILSIEVDRLNAKTAKSTEINLYDCIGNVLATVTVTQEGDKEAPLPRLGANGIAIANDLSKDFAKAFAQYNVFEQYYHYNKQSGAQLVSRNITPNSPEINNLWADLYKANRTNFWIKETDEKQLRVYQDVCNVFSAMYYYNMVVAWGDVPYLPKVLNMEDAFNIYRTNKGEILTDLKTNLIHAIEYLDEKRNEPFKDANGFFLVSKDVARILLAQIYMYQGEYQSAEPLLAKVIENNFYELDDSNFSIGDIASNKNGKEIIFGLQSPVQTKSTKENIHITRQSLIPVLTYTDVVLSYAECLHKAGKTSDATAQLNKVATAKGITVSNDPITGISEARRKLLLYSIGNFAFLKRNNIAQEVCAIDKYHILLPIPQREIYLNPMMTQNPGW